VLAYDILFNPVATKEVKDDQKNVKIMRDLETNGNKEFENSLIDFDDARSQGQPAPRALFAYYFPDNIVGDTHLDKDEQEQQEKWFKKLDLFRLPPGSVAPGGSAPVFHTVRLPMKEILSAPSYYLGAINIKPDEDGVYRRAPMLYAYQPPGSTEVRYVPGFALEAFLLWLDIEPQDLKRPGEGLPCLTAEPGGDLKIMTNGEWSLPVDDQFRMAIVPRFKFKSETVSSVKPALKQEIDSKIKFDTELFQPSFVDLLEHGMVKAEADKIIPLTTGRILVVGDGLYGRHGHGRLPPRTRSAQRPAASAILNNILQNDHLAKISFLVKALICFVARRNHGLALPRADPFARSRGASR
jgi:hypothetical protein